MKKTVLRIVLLAAIAPIVAATASTLHADTFFVPNPVLNGGNKPVTKLQVVKTSGGPNRLTPIFIPGGKSGVNLTGTAVNVDNDVKPNVFDVHGFIGGPGMLEVQGDPGISVAAAALLLSTKTETGAWPLPVVSAGDWVNGGETAYLQGLGRGGAGYTNLEVMNLSPLQNSCQFQLRRPQGSPNGNPVHFSVAPLTEISGKDILFGRTILDTYSVRMEVTCSQPFYAFGTFIANVPLQFAIFYPQDSPPAANGGAVTLDRAGNFFAPVEGNSQLNLVLPLVPGRSYRQVAIDFDLQVDKFTPLFTSIMGLFHIGGPRFNKTLYYGFNIRGVRQRALVDQGQATLEPALQRNAAFQEGGAYHFHMFYDAENALLRIQAASPGGQPMFDALGGAFNLDLADRGNPVQLVFGLNGVADGAYFPPMGWTFSNLHVVATE